MLKIKWLYHTTTCMQPSLKNKIIPMFFTWTKSNPNTDHWEEPARIYRRFWRPPCLGTEMTAKSHGSCWAKTKLKPVFVALPSRLFRVLLLIALKVIFNYVKRRNRLSIILRENESLSWHIFQIWQFILFHLVNVAKAESVSIDRATIARLKRLKAY